MQLISVGKQKDAEIGVLIDDYRKRLHGKITETTLSASTAPQALQRQEKEAIAIRQALLPQHKMIVLDERGQNIDSPQFAALIQKWTDDNLSLAFVIGGADGVHESLRQDAHYILSFGKLTWPHRMVRLMLYEQIYRAHTINTGHPYHRE
ncbi:MAG TPA: 23S rRNA (pseudouridine(1915)-N(3))-methyltransferase RlmH [Alphaproteobacteria bacterium]